MLNKKGFALIETIITMVVLLTTLVLLYSGFNSFFIKEQNNLYLDDIAYIYKTEYVARVLFGDSTASGIVDLNNLKADTNAYYVTSSSSSSICDDENDACTYVYMLGSNAKGKNFYNEEIEVVTNSTIYNNIVDLYNINHIAYININNIDNLKKCINGDDVTTICTNTKKRLTALYSTLSDNNDKLYSIIKKMDLEEIEAAKDKGANAILLVSYFESKSGKEVHLGTTGSTEDYASCISEEKTNGTKKYTTMDCEKAINFAWVYLYE